MLFIDRRHASRCAAEQTNRALMRAGTWTSVP